MATLAAVAGWELLVAAAAAFGAIIFMAETARQIIEKYKKGSIWREFPGEWADKTMEEIERAARAGDKSAQKAKKLLTDGRFNK
jgi:hypothetical protein